MNPISKILVIVDPTAALQPAVDKAGLLAQKLDARLELFACDTKASREVRMAAHARMDPDRPFVVNLKPMLEELAAPLRARGIDVTTETECADPLHVALMDRVRRTTAELVVKDTHHHGIAQRTFLTNTDWQLIRCCPAPLLLTKSQPWHAVPRIVAAVDPGHANDKPTLLDNRILEYAAALARCLGGDLHAMHAYLPVAIVAAAAAGTPPMPIVSPEDIDSERAAKVKEIAALVSDYGVDQKSIHLEFGGPAEVLPRATSKLHADIVAMGAISRRGWQRAFIGATAEDVLERMVCDLLIVKPPNFAELLPF